MNSSTEVRSNGLYCVTLGAEVWIVVLRMIHSTIKTPLDRPTKELERNGPNTKRYYTFYVSKRIPSMTERALSPVKAEIKRKRRVVKAGRVRQVIREWVMLTSDPRARG